MHVLYVEDSPVDADLTRRALAAHAPDIVLEIVRSTAAARSQLASGNFDLLLTDLKLPDGSGLELLNGLRAAGSRLPVVLVTGQGDLHSAMNALKAGAQDYVVKRDGYLDTLPAVLHRQFAAQRMAVRRGRPLRVLYAEPDPAQARQAAGHLTRHAPHIELHTVDTAAQVIARLTEARPEAPWHVLLVDHQLAGGDSLELVRALRERHQVGLPIVLASDHGDEQVAALALHLGVDDFLPKDDGFLFALPATLEKVHREHELLAERDALRALNDRHTQLLAASPTLTYRLRIEGEHHLPVWISENMERMLGYPVAEALVPSWWWDHIHAEDRDLIREARKHLIAHGHAEVSYRFRHRDGRLVWIRERERMLYDAAGQPVEIVGTWNDVTEETVSGMVREARMELREMMFAGHALGDILACCTAHITRCFPGRLAAILLLAEGRQRFDLAADSGLADAFGDSARTQAAALVSDLPAAARSGQCFVIDADTADNPPASWRALMQATAQVRARHLPLLGKSGRLLGILAVYGALPEAAEQTDTPRLAEFAQMATLAAERSAQEQIQRQAFAALSDTRDGVVITDLQPAIVSINQAWTDITGYSRDEALGKNPSLLKSGMEAPERYQEMWHELLNTGSWQGELWNRRKNGETYPQLLSISTVRDTAGTPTHYVGVMTDLSRLRRSEDEKERLTHYDPLTHLPNRMLAMSRLQHAIELAGRQQRNIGVLYLDLDLFKHINDSLGHTTGDKVLVQVARRLEGCLRNNETLARLGGDEFLIIIEQLDVADDVARLATTLLDALHQPIALDGEADVYVAGSIGISLYPGDGDTAQAMVQHADTALNEAKKQGRDQYCFYTQSQGERIRQRLRMESQLRQALERGELSLHYQPQVDIRSGRINGIEALMRWHNPALGDIPPGEFIPVAEQSGLILPMGRWALQEACRQNKRWQDEGLPQLCMAVNVSVRQFKDRGLVDTVREALENSALPPSCLEIELTESAFVEDAETAIRTSQQLHALGVKLSLDDFGTGYSSLAYLSRFPFDKIKIDQSFVRDITSNPTNAAIANATIALADSLHMAVLAEGVETESQLNFLRQRGCSSMQGYLFSRPLAADALGALLREARTLPAAPATESAPRTLLLLDDEANILRALQRLLRQDGYRILATTNAAEAFDLLAQNRVQVIVSDQRMPEMNGTEFLSRVKELYPDTIRIVLSGYSEVDSITQAVNRGAIYKFFTKPWDDMQLREELRDAFRVAEKTRHD